MGKRLVGGEGDVELRWKLVGECGRYLFCCAGPKIAIGGIDERPPSAFVRRGESAFESIICVLSGLKYDSARYLQRLEETLVCAVRVDDRMNCIARVEMPV